MTDVAIRAPATHAAPEDYTIPGAQELLPKSVAASMDGSAATSTWYPALQFVEPGGNVMVTAVSTTGLAAGASADVSWFPHIACCPTTSTANYDAVVTALGPWAYWKLADGASATQAVDSSGHGRTMNIDTGHVNMGQTGLLPTIPTQSCAFSVWTAATNVQNFTTVNSQTYSASVVTVEHWVKTPGHGANEQDLSCMGTLNSASSRLWRCFLNSSGQPVFEFYGNDAALHTFTFAGAVTDNAVHQVVYVMDGTNVKSYLDGVLISSQTAGATMNAPLTSSVYLCQPAGGAGSRDLDGYLGPVVVYDKALTAAQIANLYANGTGTTSGGAVASVTAADTSITIGGTATNPTVATGSLDLIASNHPTAANWSNNTHKITGLTEGAAAGEAATYAATDAGIVTAKGDLVAATGSHAVARVAVGADNTVLTADSTQASGVKWGSASGSPLTTKGDIFGHSTVDARIPVGSNGQVLIADSAQTLGVRWGAGTSTGSNVDIQTFAAGAGQTWTKPTGVTVVRVIAVSAGGGGGGGQGSAAGTTRHGGGSGGGGGKVQIDFLASILGGTETVNVGGGGGGGNGGSGGPGVNGTAGGNTTFGSWLTVFGGGFGPQGQGSTTNNIVGGGGGGVGGAPQNGFSNTASPTIATGAGQGAAKRGYGTAGGTGQSSNTAEQAGAEWGGGGGVGESAASFTSSGGGGSVYGGGGGGSGGGVTSANVANAGQAGGASGTYGQGGGGGGGAATGAAGTAGTNGTLNAGGAGGGGGGGNTAGTGGKGGAGGLYGGGGGGGGGGTTVGGAGGNGGDGLCIVLSW